MKGMKIMKSEKISKIKIFLINDCIEEFTEFCYSKNKNSSLGKIDIRNKVFEYSPYIERVINIAVLSYGEYNSKCDLFFKEKRNLLKKDIYRVLKSELRPIGRLPFVFF